MSTDIGFAPSETPIIRPPVVRGRDVPLAVVRDRVLASRDRGGSVVVVEGRAGVGKSRLLAEAADGASRAGVRVGAGGARPGDEAVGLASLMAAIFDGPAPLADPRELSRLHAQPEERYWLVHELEMLLVRAAGRAPVLVCLDDLHCADEATLVALTMLSERLRQLPVVWLIACRAGASRASVLTTVHRLTRAGAQELTLGPLGEPDVVHVVVDMVGAEPSPALLSLIAGARGSPLLVVELVRGLLEEGLVRVEDGRAELLAPCLPTRVHQEMHRRLDTVSLPARRAAGLAAVLGRAFSFDHLAALLDQRPTVLLERVDELVRAEVLAEDGESLRFVDDLAFRVVADTVPAAARRSLHRQASVILLDAGGSPRDVAMHLAASAGSGGREALSTIRQAVRTLGPSDPGAAADLGRRGIALTAPGDPRRGALVAETALQLHAADRVDEASALADTVLRDGLPPAEEASVRLGVARMTGLSPDVRTAADERSLALPGLTDQGRARHLAQLAHNLTAAGRIRRATTVVVEAEAAVHAADDAGAAFVLALARSGLDYVDGAYGRAGARLDAALAGGAATEVEAAQIDLAELWRSELMASTDHLDEALRRTSGGAAGARRDRQAWAARAWLAVHGRHLLQAGRLAAAGEALTDRAGTAGAVPRNVLDAAAVVALGRVAIHTVDHRLTQACADLATAMVREGAPEVRRHGAWLLALQAMAVDEPGAARRHLVELGDDAGGWLLPRLMVDVTDPPHLMRLALAAGDDELADRALGTAERRHVLNPGVASIEGAAAHARGLRRHDHRELVRAAALLSDGPRPLAHASVLEDLGCELVRRGERAAAIAALGSALERYADATATWDVGRVRRRLRVLGVRRRLVRPRVDETGWGGLTESELAVVRLVAHGLTNRAVAARLFVSRHTVGTHLRHAFAKLGITSRVELTRFVVAHDGADV